MTNELTINLEKLHIVAGAIQSNCDGAREIDGVGFNKFDAEFFKRFVYSYEPSFSEMLKAYTSLKKYKKQISSLGYTELFESIKFDADLLKREYIENSKEELLTLVENAPEKKIPSKNKSVKAIEIGNKKWIWDLYKDESVGKEWFKSNGLSLYKNEYLGGIWQVTKWFDLEPTTPDPKPPTKFGIELFGIERRLVKPSEITLNHSDKLLAYQIDHVKYLLASLENFNAVLDASDTGTGKTFSALACAKELGLIPVILTPKAVIPSWIRACSKHFDIGDYFVTNYESIKTGKTEYLVRGKEDDFQWNLDPQKHILIFDEVHRCKNKDTLNAKMLVSAKESKVKTVCLSATIADNPTQLFAVGVTLGLFSNRYYNTWLRSLGGYYNENEMRYIFPESSLLTVNNQIFPNRGHRISVKELGNLFPETRILPDVFTVSDASQKRINDLYDAITIALGELKQKEKSDKGHHLTEILRARQEIELIKVPVFVDLAQDALEENNSVVIIVNFTETLNALAEKLHTKCVVHGQQTAQEREKNIADFQADKERIIILNIRSGGVGVSLHDLNGNHPRVSLISPSWSAQDVVQAVGRVWRAGSKSSSIQKVVYCANTIEESICEKMKEKIDNINKINEASVSDVFASLLPEEE
jgi:superfamily II DNA or RNA helicase